MAAETPPPVPAPRAQLGGGSLGAPAGFLRGSRRGVLLPALLPPRRDLEAERAASGVVGTDRRGGAASGSGGARNRSGLGPGGSSADLCRVE